MTKDTELFKDYEFRLLVSSIKEGKYLDAKHYIHQGYIGDFSDERKFARAAARLRVIGNLVFEKDAAEVCEFLIFCYPQYYGVDNLRKLFKYAVKEGKNKIASLVDKEIKEFLSVASLRESDDPCIESPKDGAAAKGRPEFTLERAHRRRHSIRGLGDLGGAEVPDIPLFTDLARREAERAIAEAVADGDPDPEVSKDPLKGSLLDAIGPYTASLKDERDAASKRDDKATAGRTD